jgi:hypothetical protein
MKKFIHSRCAKYGQFLVKLNDRIVFKDSSSLSLTYDMFQKKNKELRRVLTYSVASVIQWRITR